MKIRILLFAFVFGTGLSTIAQRTIPPTESFQILGQVKNPTTFQLTELDTFPKSPIKDQIIYNHKGEIKDTLSGMTGISIKTLLSSIHYNYEKTRDLNEFYFVFMASDGYKVVISWNEIYNTATGDYFFIVTEMEGKKLKELDQRIVFISTADLKSGRRYIKGLSKIEVKRVQ